MIRKKIIQALCKVTGESNIHLETPETESHGDYSSNVAMQLASKKLGSNPRQLAEVIVKKLSKDNKLSKYVSKIEVAGPGFINFWLKKETLTDELQSVLGKKDAYGQSNLFKNKKILLEHTSPNTIKTLHVGHVRNNVLGVAMHNILEFAGAKVAMDAINNDRGIHVMKAVWAYLKFGKGKTPATEKKKPDQFVDGYYVKGAKAYENDEKVKKETRELLRKWEDEDEKIVGVWKKLRGWTLEGFRETYQKLDSCHDHQWFESDYYKKGRKIVEDGIKKGVFKKLEDGAVLSQLEEYNLPDTIVLRADGTTMYHTQDLYLTKQKREKYPSNIYIWDVGPEQTLYLKQLFAMSEQLGFGKVNDYFHLSYGFVYLKGKGKMSSRAGTVISADWLIDEIIKKAEKVVKESETGGDFSQKELARISEAVGLAAIKYGFLKLARTSDIHFDIDELLSMQGNSGPYLQYTYARTQSVLSKSGRVEEWKSGSDWKLENGNWKINTEEMSLLRTFVKFQEVVEEAAKNYAPNLICNYLYGLAQKYNAFYNAHKILEPESKRAGEREKMKNFRLTLTVATGQILKNGFSLISIQAPERM